MENDYGYNESQLPDSKSARVIGSPGFHEYNHMLDKLEITHDFMSRLKKKRKDKMNSEFKMQAVMTIITSRHITAVDAIDRKNIWTCYKKFKNLIGGESKCKRVMFTLVYHPIMIL